MFNIAGIVEFGVLFVIAAELEVGEPLAGDGVGLDISLVL